MWTLVNDTDTTRTYQNSVTGVKSEQSMVKIDRDGNKWWSFSDLSAIPFVRTFAAQKITSLYALGLSKDDLHSHIGNLKKILKSTEADKYEKAFALVLDFEVKANNATDPLKQMSGLTTVYFTLNDEPIDSFDNQLQIKKMSIIESDTELHAFFLNRLISTTESYITAYNLISQTAFQKTEESN